MQAKKTVLLGPILLLMIPAVAAQDYTARVEIENDLVRVSRGWIGPDKILSIANMPAALFVFLTDHRVQLTTADRNEELRGDSGGFLWHSGGRIGLKNLSEHRLELAQVAPKFSPGTEELSTLLSRRSVAFENNLIHVKRLHFQKAGPTGYPSRDHVLPAIVIHLSAAHITLTHADGRVEDVRMKPGDIRFEPRGYFSGLSMKVSGENVDDWVEVLRIQLKAGKR